MRDENSYNRKLRRLHHTERIIQKRARVAREACGFSAYGSWNPFQVPWEPYYTRRGQLFYFDSTASHRLVFALLVLPKLGRAPFEEIETFDGFCEKADNLSYYYTDMWIFYREENGSIWFFATSYFQEDRERFISKGGRWGNNNCTYIFPREVFTGRQRYYFSGGRRQSTAGYDPSTLREIETLEECRLDEWNPWPLYSGGCGGSTNPKQPNKPNNTLSKRGGSRRRDRKVNRHHNTRVYSDKTRYYSTARDAAQESAAVDQIRELQQAGIYGNYNPRKFTRTKGIGYSW